ncbi:ribbon-helix-helix domain-containing protein [Halorhodospira halophila]|uniref:ribbon-helix-helix domain-containing protein n=1 Tax=Halorhodospira halophila TaxID=1053 RepID=UPI0019133DC8|nr:ribbon-helix-helix domain-containing protein [Halorhodospira halophila]MBK5944812.1 hypothetical protein [Halorhodospira halophila]
MSKRKKLNVEALRSEATGYGNVVEKAARTRSRAQKEQITAWVTPGLRKQMKLLAVEQDRSVESLVDEAITDLLDKHGR